MSADDVLKTSKRHGGEADLRSRITDAVWDEARTIGSTLSLKASGLIADAVIAELGLTRECRECGTTGDCVCECDCCPRDHRYVTDWTADE